MGKAVRFLVSEYGSPSATRKTRGGGEYLWWNGQRVHFFARQYPRGETDPTSLILFETCAFTERLAASSREQKEKAKQAY